MRKRRRAFCSRACRHNSTTELQGNSSGALLLLVLHRAWLTTPCSDLSDLLTKRVRVLSKLMSIISAMIGRRSWLSYQFMSGRAADVRVLPLVFGHKYPNFFRHYSVQILFPIFQKGLIFFPMRLSTCICSSCTKGTSTLVLFADSEGRET